MIFVILGWQWLCNLLFICHDRTVFKQHNQFWNEITFIKIGSYAFLGIFLLGAFFREIFTSVTKRIKIVTWLIILCTVNCYRIFFTNTFVEVSPTFWKNNIIWGKRYILIYNLKQSQFETYAFYFQFL